VSKTKPIHNIAFSSFLLLQIVIAGCSLPHKVGISKTGIPEYDRIHIVYDRLDAEGILLGNWIEQCEATSSGESLETPTGELGKTASRVRLTIEYPLPNSAQELARATVQLIPAAAVETSVSQAPTSFVGYVRDGVQKLLPGENETNTPQAVEIGVYDFPRQELDLLLIDLAKNGFFGSQTRPGTKSRIHVQVDRGKPQNHGLPTRDSTTSSNRSTTKIVVKTSRMSSKSSSRCG
jgi:hypothetical protein